VVLKSACPTPWCAMALVECFQEAGVPDGVLNLITGDGHEVGETLVTHPDVAAISFTGSNEVGNRIAALGGQRRAKVQLEMGGKNAIIVLEDGDLELAVGATLLGAFGSTGQRCTATSRVVVDKKVSKKFVELLVERTKSLQVGPGNGSKDYMGPLVDENQLRTVTSYLEVAKQEGAELVIGGKRLEGGAHAHGYYVAPTIYCGVRPEFRIAREEIFGPVLSVIETSGFEEALAAANDGPYGLTSSIYTRDVNQVFRYIDQIDVGMVHINSATIGGEVQVPFGGTKATGFGGREMGNTAIDFFTEWKSVYVDYTGVARTSKIY
jgi:acyl-CoA reductase-like NAD-dependent aldehyde dehydrogenase